MAFKTNQLYQLVLTQLLETLREPSVLFWGIVFPILITIGLGLAFTQTSESKYRIAIVEGQPTKLDTLLSVYGKEEKEQGETSISWKVSNPTLGNTQYLFVRHQWNDAIIALKRGEVDLIVTDSIGEIRYHFDPQNVQAQFVYMKLSGLLEEPSIQTEQYSIKPLTLKGVRYIDFLLPGLIALGILNGLCWGISYSLVERRSQKLLRRMVATPMKKSNYLIALISVRFVMNCLETSVLFFFAWLLFGTIIQGNMGALIFFYISGNIAFSGIAVLLGCHTAKLETGNGLINAIIMPMMILSGIFFSYLNFPAWSISFIKLLPLTSFTDGLRSIFNEGAGWPEIVVPSISLASLGIICFIVGVKWFKWY